MLDLFMSKNHPSTIVKASYLVSAIGAVEVVRKELRIYLECEARNQDYQAFML